MAQGQLRERQEAVFSLERQGNVEKYKKVKWSEILLATLLGVYHTLCTHFKLF